MSYNLRIKASFLSPDLLSSKVVIDRMEPTVKKYEATVFEPKQIKDNAEIRLDAEILFDLADRSLADHIRSIFERIARDNKADYIEAKVEIKQLSTQRAYPYSVQVKQGKKLQASIGKIPSTDLTAFFSRQAVAPNPNLIYIPNSIELQTGATQETEAFLPNNTTFTGSFFLEASMNTTGGNTTKVNLNTAGATSGVELIAFQDANGNDAITFKITSNNSIVSTKTSAYAHIAVITRVGKSIMVHLKESGAWKLVGWYDNYDTGDMDMSLTLDGMSGNSKFSMTTGGY